ncbi:MAG: ABC transporter permease, partial [Coriobacteriia bacterium]|nr:ABC transporter permease [Coriobacteriia bacterium]
NLIEITYGRTLSAEEVGSLSLVAMVSESFAQVNNLAVGSIVTLQNIAWDKRGHESSGSDLYTEDNIFARQSYDFEIVGIFTSLVDYNTGSEFMDGIFQNQAENRIYVPNAVSAQANLFQLAQMGEMEPDVRYWQENTEDLLLYENIYLLHDFAEMNSFRQEAEKMLPDFYTVVNATDSYTNITSSMEPLSNLATTAMWAIAIVAVLILSLLITLSLHNRKHEIGTLLALGEKRRKIVLQMMFEVLAIAVLAIALSLFVGNLFATGISESMLRTNLVATQSGDEYMYFNTLDYLGFSNNVSADDVLASYDTSLDTATILTFFAVSIGTVIVATIVPMLYILRLNPRKIMM